MANDYDDDTLFSRGFLPEFPTGGTQFERGNLNLPDDIQAYEDLMRRTAPMASMSHMPPKPMRNVDIDMFGSKVSLPLPYDQAAAVGKGLQNLYDLKTLPFYMHPMTAPFAMASDITEGVVRGDPAQAAMSAIGGISRPAAAVALPVGAAMLTATPAQGADLPKGFFSVLRDAVTGAKQRVATGAQWSGYLKPGRMVDKPGLGRFPLKMDELEYSGIDQFLKDNPEKRLSVEDLIAKLDAANQPEFQHLGSPPEAEMAAANAADEARTAIRDKLRQISGGDVQNFQAQRFVTRNDNEAKAAEIILRNRYDYSDVDMEELRKLREQYAAIPDANIANYPPSQYGRWTLPGTKDTYEEQLTHWRANLDPAHEEWKRRLDDAAHGRQFTDEEMQRVMELERQGANLTPPGNYAAPHFDEFSDNLLSHSRASRRRLDGEDLHDLDLMNLQEEFDKLYAVRDQLSPQERTRMFDIADMLNEKKTPGDKVRFIEEIQSDWHQAARDGQDVPKAPFSKTYAELELKKQLARAVEDGDEFLAITTGQQQIDRYGLALRNVVDNIKWKRNEDGTFNLQFMKSGRPAPVPGEHTNLTERDMRNLLGADMARKIGSGEEYAFKAPSGMQMTFANPEHAEKALADWRQGNEWAVADRVASMRDLSAGRWPEFFKREVKPDGRVVVRNETGDIVFTGPTSKEAGSIKGYADDVRSELEQYQRNLDHLNNEKIEKVKSSSGSLVDKDISVGGKGMRTFYDEHMPDAMRKLAKQYGGTVEEITLPGAMSVEDGTLRMPSKQWAIRITPEMRERIQKHGMPLYSGPAATAAAGAVGAAAYGTGRDDE